MYQGFFSPFSNIFQNCSVFIPEQRSANRTGWARNFLWLTYQVFSFWTHILSASQLVCSNKPIKKIEKFSLKSLLKIWKIFFKISVFSVFWRNRFGLKFFHCKTVVNVVKYTILLTLRNQILPNLAILW